MLHGSHDVLRRTYHLLVLLAVTSSLGRAKADEPETRKNALAHLVDQLADERFANRQAAAKRLRELGSAAVIVLDNASQVHPSAQVRAQAGEVIKLMPGVKRNDNHLSTTLIWCPPGEYMMGPSSDEMREKEQLTPTRVRFTRGFWLGRCEVTQKEWQTVMATSPWSDSKYTTQSDNVAATLTSWSDAQEFCRRLTDIERRARRIDEDQAFSLPTDAQWEYACRAGTKGSYFFNDKPSLARLEIGDYAWCNVNSTKKGIEKAREVGQKKPNPWGFHDVLGNVGEFCQDHYVRTSLPSGENPLVETQEDRPSYVVRGGSWQTPAPTCWERGRAGGVGGVQTGFRVALVRARERSAREQPANPAIDSRR